jgi:hypothetical protein
MTGGEVLALVLGSAAVGALASSIVTGTFNRKDKRAELERRDMEMALKMAELKHQQVVTTYNWHAAQGRDPGVTFIDPFMSVIDYHKGMEEFRKTGRWAKGEAGHPRPQDRRAGDAT